MSIGHHRYVEIKDGDLVYINDSIYRQRSCHGVETWSTKLVVVKPITQSLRVSDTGMRDLQLMINLLQPNYLFPIQVYTELDAQGCQSGWNVARTHFHP